MYYWTDCHIPRRQDHFLCLIICARGSLADSLNASDLLGKNNEIGSLAQGKLADLIGVSENPLEDITILETVDFVMKGGKVVKQP